MSIARIYQAKKLKLNETFTLDEKAAHHIARVLRAAPHDKLTIFNGEGGEYQAVITQIDKKGVTVNLTAFSAREVESPIHIFLAQGIARGEKMDFIIQKAVELGVSKIMPLLTARCNVKLANEREEKRLAHWQSVAISAAEQCGRNHLPEILAPLSFSAWLPQATADQCFVLSPHLSPKLPEASLPAQASILLLIGPEGGLSEAEIQAAKDRHFIPLNLGPRVLRTETASIAAIATLQYRFGDIGKTFDSFD